MSLEQRVRELEAELAAARAEVRATKEKFDTVIGALPVGVALITPDGVVEEANALYVDGLALPRETVVGRLVLERLMGVAMVAMDPMTGERLSPEARSAWIERRWRQYLDLDQAPDTMEYAISDQQTLRTMSQRAPNGWLVQIFQNVTEIRRVDQTIRSAIEALPVSVALFEGDHKLTHFNKAFLDAYAPEVRDQCRLGASYLDLAFLMYRSAIRVDVEKAGRQPIKEMSDEELRALLRARAEIVHAQSRAAVAEFALWDGRIMLSRTVQAEDGRAINVMVDVTDQRRTSRRLAEVIHNIDGAVFLFDQDMKLLLWSPSTPKLFEFLQPILAEGVHSDRVRQAILNATISEDRGLYDGRMQATYVRRFLDGRAIQVRRTPTADGGLLIVCNDITEIQQTNLLASRAQRIESLGLLVAGLAHEINTPLGVAVTTASFIESEVRQMATRLATGELTSENMTRHFAVTEKATAMLLRNLDRAADLIARFKRVSVDELSVERSNFRLAQVVKDTLEMMEPQIKAAGHRIEHRCPPDLTLNSYPSAIIQVLSNLVSNSLSHGYPDERSGLLKLEIDQADKWVEITYSDDGAGVPPEILGRIFEHFFTTRRGKGGSGLGLGIVHNLVSEQLGGEVKASSPPGEGLRIEIRIPVQSETADQSVLSGGPSA
jgi:signal transduction histidine kinase